MALPSLAAVGSFLGGLGSVMGSRGSGNAEAARQFDKSYKHARDQFTQGIRYRVKDARLAGIHPLFALGASPAGGQVVPTVMGQHPSGSAVGSALTALGEGARSLAQGRLASRAASLAERQADASINRDNAQAMYYASLAKKTELEAQSGAKTYPYPTGPSRSPLVQREPLRIGPNVRKVQGRVERVAGGPWRISNPGLGARLEEDYGEFGGLFAVLPSMISDVISNVLVPQRGGARWQKSRRSGRALKSYGRPLRARMKDRLETVRRAQRRRESIYGR